MASAALPAHAVASTSFGSSLSRAPGTAPGCSPSCTFQQTRFAGAGVVSPVSGVVTAWRVRTAGPASALRLRVLRDTLGAGSSAPVNAAAGVNAFQTRVPIRAGDGIGLDWSGGGAVVASDLLLLGNSTLRGWRPALADGQSLAPNVGDFSLPPVYELQLNATVEPDSDVDAYGDETQDGCIGQAGPVCADGSSTPPPGAQGGVAGATGGSGGKRLLKVEIAAGARRIGKGGIVPVKLTCPAGLIARCSGTLLLETAKPVGSQGKTRARKLRLGGATFSIAPGKSSVARVPLTPKNRKILRRLGRVPVIARGNTLDATGHTSTARAVIVLTTR